MNPNETISPDRRSILKGLAAAAATTLAAPAIAAEGLPPPPTGAAAAIATGFCGHGFAMGPIVGKLLAELNDGGEASLDLSAFRLQRFFDGTMQRPRSML